MLPSAISAFITRPVIAKLLTMASFTGMVNLLTGEGMGPFRILTRRLNTRTARSFVNDGKAFGNVMGITGSGAYNRATEVLDVKGVIAPAYSINTFIGKLPLVGSLLAGKDGTDFCRQLYHYRRHIRSENQHQSAVGFKPKFAERPVLQLVRRRQ